MNSKRYEFCNIALTCIVIVFAARNDALASLALIVIAFDIVFFGVNRIPVSLMNLPIRVTDADRAVVAAVVRLHVAAIGTAAIALFTWMAICIAIDAMPVYLATFWVFLAAIAVALVRMVRALRQAQGDTETGSG